jgi:capsular polysaccharide biosynthesis protein
LDLRGYLHVLVKRGWIILLVAVLTAGSAWGISRLQTVTYRSSIQMNVIPARLDWGLQQTIKGLMRNYSGQIKSRTTVQDIINHTTLDLSVDAVLEKLTVSPIESDFLIQIDVDDIDPERAQLIAQTAAEIFVEANRVQMLEQDKRDRVDVTIRDHATPAVVFWPKTNLLVLAGGLFGLLAGALVTIGLEQLGADIIRDSRDLERRTGLTVLGSVPAIVVNKKSAPRSLKEGN